MQVSAGGAAPYRDAPDPGAGARAPSPGEAVGGRYLVEQLLSADEGAWRLSAVDTAGAVQRVILHVLRPGRDRPVRAKGAAGGGKGTGGEPGVDRELLARAETHLGALLRAHEDRADLEVERPLDPVVIEHRGLPVIVLENIEGTSLSEALERGGPMSPGEVARTGARVARALEGLHEAGGAHGALSASNVRLRGDTPVLVGTRGRGDQAADIHALGLLLWQAAMGTRPRDVERAARAALSSGGKRLPSSLGAILLACLGADGVVRPRAGDVAAMLQPMAGRATGAARGAGDGKRADGGRGGGRRLVAFAVGGAAAGVAVVLGVVTLLGG